MATFSSVCSVFMLLLLIIILGVIVDTDMNNDIKFPVIIIIVIIMASHIPALIVNYRLSEYMETPEYAQYEFRKATEKYNDFVDSAKNIEMKKE